MVPAANNTVNPGLIVTDGYTVTELNAEDTPLANSLLDVDCCILHLLIMLAALIMQAITIIVLRKRKAKSLALQKQLKN